MVFSMPVTWHICGAWCLWQVQCLASGGSQVRIPLKTPRSDLGQVLHSQLPVALRCVISSTVSSMLYWGVPQSSSGLEEML